MFPQARENPDHRKIQIIEEVLREHGFEYVEGQDSDPVIYATKGCKQNRIGLKSVLMTLFTEKELKDMIPHFLR